MSRPLATAGRATNERNVRVTFGKSLMPTAAVFTALLNRSRALAVLEQSKNSIIALRGVVNGASGKSRPSGGEPRHND